MNIKSFLIQGQPSYKAISLTLVVCVLVSLASCKTHRDCKGRKKTAKTAMGGWL